MSKLNTVLLMIAMAAAGLFFGNLYNNWQQQQKLSQVPTSSSKQAPLATVRPLFKLKDLEDKTRDIKEWDGKVLLVNFWATWCPPCRKEIPAFIKLQEKYQDKGFQIIGVALDEKQAVIDFTDPMGVNYPVLMAADEGIKLSKAYGNRLGVLPFSVIVDRKGKIIHRQRSELSFEQVEGMIKPLL